MHDWVRLAKSHWPLRLVKPRHSGVCLADLGKRERPRAGDQCLAALAETASEPDARTAAILVDELDPTGLERG